MLISATFSVAVWSLSGREPLVCVIGDGIFIIPQYKTFPRSCVHHHIFSLRILLFFTSNVLSLLSTSFEMYGEFSKQQFVHFIRIKEAKPSEVGHLPSKYFLCLQWTQKANWFKNWHVHKSKPFYSFFGFTYRWRNGIHFAFFCKKYFDAFCWKLLLLTRISLPFYTTFSVLVTSKHYFPRILLFDPCLL